MRFEPFDREMIRRLYGVDTVPGPLGPREESGPLETATAAFPRGSVLVDLDIDAEGRVTDARVIEPPPATRDGEPVPFPGFRTTVAVGPRED